MQQSCWLRRIFSNNTWHGAAWSTVFRDPPSKISRSSGSTSDDVRYSSTPKNQKAAARHGILSYLGAVGCKTSRGFHHRGATTRQRSVHRTFALLLRITPSRAVVVRGHDLCSRNGQRRASGSCGRTYFWPEIGASVGSPDDRPGGFGCCCR